ncbi:bifunctional UDP-N-acetylglucosamine diphosphorylase/glucosamine-1-phosphate N-acetyltransferase GlmU [Candidatus Albibeggiatoa sp. nov. BB20]|uniref:bifunctional UDP-N-acetylglucosamine diphosphorylase/glucosamine-1-phosphate N-acetyltransferase GlmU n=1 Tax=Candidatus Albibeggiatoa sp. nov. BB20 TaxID=3162723 RepID=UPI0033659704
MKLAIVILAAGQGKRMHSDLPKVLHPLADKPLLQHVIDTAMTLKPNDIYVIYGHGGNHVREHLQHCPVHWVEQKQQLGTGHAVAQAMPSIDDDTLILVLYGDVPLIQTETLQALCHPEREQTLRLLTASLDNPKGYGRIMRNAANQVTQIIEEKDADNNIRQITEVNTGILAVPAYYLRKWLNALNTSNAQGEYYLTDVIEMAAQAGINIFTHQPNFHYEVQGINDRMQLSELERYYQKKQAIQLMQSGVTLKDPVRLDIRGTVKTGFDVSIDVNVILEGDVTLGHRVTIGANTIIKNSTIGDDCEILPNSLIENAQVGMGCRVGPYARLRPDAKLADNVHVGNFVEIKKTTVASGSKINHLSYIGDAEIGSDVNIGAGTITCNYDGVNKSKTTIGDNAFIGSGTQLVAPVCVGGNVTIGAGSTITKDTPDSGLTLSRSPQASNPSWQRPQKKS